MQVEKSIACQQITSIVGRTLWRVASQVNFENIFVGDIPVSLTIEANTEADARKAFENCLLAISGNLSGFNFQVRGNFWHLRDESGVSILQKHNDLLVKYKSLEGSVLGNQPPHFVWGIHILSSSEGVGELVVDCNDSLTLQNVEWHRFSEDE